MATFLALLPFAIFMSWVAAMRHGEWRDRKSVASLCAEIVVGGPVTGLDETARSRKMDVLVSPSVDVGGGGTTRATQSFIAGDSACDVEYEGIPFSRSA